MTSSARWPLLAIPAGLLLAFIYVWPSLGLFRTAFNETTARRYSGTQKMSAPTTNVSSRASDQRV